MNKLDRASSTARARHVGLIALLLVLGFGCAPESADPSASATELRGGNGRGNAWGHDRDRDASFDEDDDADVDEDSDEGMDEDVDEGIDEDVDEGIDEDVDESTGEGPGDDDAG